jgi:hypothetical protein
MITVEKRISVIVPTLDNVDEKMLITTLMSSMGTYKVKRPVHGEWHLPTLTTPMMMDHATIQGKITFRWNNVPHPTPTDSTYYVHLFWTFLRLFLVVISCHVTPL